MKRTLGLTAAAIGSFLVAFLFLSAAHYYGVSLAEAQTAPVSAPVQQALTTTDGGWGLVQAYGPIWGGMLIAFGLATAFVARNEKAQWLKPGRRLAATVGAVGILGSILEAHFGGASWAGVIVTIIGVAKMLLNPTVPANAPPSTASKTVLVGMLALFVGLSAGVGCKTYLPPSTHPVIDCIAADRSFIDRTVDAMLNAQNLDTIENIATDAGVVIGGCALHEFVQKYLSPAPGKHAPDPAYGWKLREIQERFRSEKANGATFHTPAGDL